MRNSPPSLRNRLTAVVAFAFFITTYTPLAGYGQTAAPTESSPSMSASPPSTATTLPSGTNLDLRSTNRTLIAPNTSSIAIQVGRNVARNTVTTINPGQQVTPAEYLALTQIMQTGTQSLVIASTGAARSGSATITPGSLGGNLSNLFLPRHVNLAGVGFDSSNPLNVTGSATIGGAMHALQNQAGI